MEKGKPYFVIWFAELKTELNAQDAYNGIHQGQTEISVGYIEALKGEIASPNALLTKIKDLERDTNDRIKVLDGKKDYNKWLLQAIIGLLTAISLKLFWDNNQFDKGYELGVKEKLAKQEVQKAISELSLDSIVSIKVHNSITTNIKNINRTKSDSTKRSEKAK